MDAKVKDLVEEKAPARVPRTVEKFLDDLTPEHARADVYARAAAHGNELDYWRWRAMVARLSRVEDLGLAAMEAAVLRIRRGQIPDVGQALADKIRSGKIVDSLFERLPRSQWGQTSATIGWYVDLIAIRLATLPKEWTDDLLSAIRGGR